MVDLGQNLLDTGGPDKRLGVGVVLRHVIVDGAYQIGHARKAPATNALLAEFAKPAIGEIQPRRPGRGVVEMEALRRV